MRLRLFNLLCILLGGLFLYIGSGTIGSLCFPRVQQAGYFFLFVGLFLTFVGLSYTIANPNDGSLLSRYSFDKWTPQCKLLSFVLITVSTIFAFIQIMY